MNRRRPCAARESASTRRLDATDEPGEPAQGFATVRAPPGRGLALPAPAGTSPAGRRAAGLGR
eukprot:8875950-Alexandrium_andersonii.AAC.1